MEVKRETFVDSKAELVEVNRDRRRQRRGMCRRHKIGIDLQVCAFEIHEKSGKMG